MINEKISPWQLTCIIIGYLLGTSVLYSFSVNHASRDAWISEILALLSGFVILMIIGYITKMFPEKNVEEILDTLFPSYIKKIMLFFFFIYAVILGSLVLNNIENFMVEMVMQEVPPVVFIITMVITSALILRQGIEVFSRCSEIFIPFIVITFAVLITAAFTLIDINNLKPVLYTNPSSIFKAVIVTSFFPYLEVSLLLFIFVLLNNKKRIFSYSLSGLLIAGVILVMRPIQIVGIFGNIDNTMPTFPIYSIIRQVTLGDFLERIEFILLFSWFLTVFIKLSICIYAAARSYSYIFNIKEYKNVILPVAVLLIPLALKAYANFKEPVVFINTSWPILSFFIQLLPVLFIFVAIFIKKIKNP